MLFRSVESLQTLRDDYLERAEGRLTIATTHTYARYVLPRVVERFIKRYPQVRLSLQQGNPTQICEAVEAGEADLAVGTETMRPFPHLAMLPCFPVARIRPSSKSAKTGTGRIEQNLFCACPMDGRLQAISHDYRARNSVDKSCSVF